MPKVGFKHSEESREKIRLSSTERYVPGRGFTAKTYQCPHCEKMFSQASGKLHGTTCLDREKYKILFPSGEFTSRQFVGFRRNLRANYKITIDEYLTIFLEQEGKCAICHQVNLSDKKMHMDHDHISGKARGILCSDCNFILGRSQDSVERLESAIVYLKKYKD